LIAPATAGPRTAAPRAPRPSPMMPPSIASFPVVIPRNLVSTSELDELDEEEEEEAEDLEEEDPLNLSWARSGWGPRLNVMTHTPIICKLVIVRNCPRLR